MQRAVISIVLATFALGYALTRVLDGRSPLSIAMLLLLGLFLGLGYTAPPLKSSYRGLGEVVAALTFGPYLVACGYLFQGSGSNSSAPLVVSLPLFFSILPSIILAGFPDRQADLAVSKRTLAVVLGTRASSILAIAFSMSAVLSGALLMTLEVKPGISVVAILPALLHAGVLTTSILRSLKTCFLKMKIEALLKVALAYIFWFSVAPLACLLWCPLELAF